MANTSIIRGTRYGIGILESHADLEQIITALVTSGIKVDEESTLSNVYVGLANVGQAVEIINGLGYTTDEDTE